MIKNRSLALPALVTGLVLSLIAIAVTVVDYAAGDLLRGHIRAGYPTLGSAEIEGAATFYLTYLATVTGLAVLCWAVTIWAVARGRRWARWLASAIFLAAVAVSLINLTITDTSGDTGLPPLLGWLGILPCLAGLAAVVQLWRPPAVANR